MLSPIMSDSLLHPMRNNPKMSVRVAIYLVLVLPVFKVINISFGKVKNLLDTVSYLSDKTLEFCITSS